MWLLILLTRMCLPPERSPTARRPTLRTPTAGGQINIASLVMALLLADFSAGNAAQVVGVGAGNKLVLGQNGGIFNSSPIASGGTYRILLSVKTLPQAESLRLVME